MAHEQYTGGAPERAAQVIVARFTRSNSNSRVGCRERSGVDVEEEVTVSNSGGVHPSFEFGFRADDNGAKDGVDTQLRERGV